MTELPRGRHHPAGRAAGPMAGHRSGQPAGAAVDRVRPDDRRARPVDLDREGSCGPFGPGDRREPRVPWSGAVEHRRRFLLLLCLVRLAEPLDAELRGWRANASRSSVRVAPAAAAGRIHRAAPGPDRAAGDQRAAARDRVVTSRGHCSRSRPGGACGSTAGPTSRSRPPPFSPRSRCASRWRSCLARSFRW